LNYQGILSRLAFLHRGGSGFYVTFAKFNFFYTNGFYITLRRMMMNNIKNFVDEKTSRKIISAICSLDFTDIHKLSEESGVPVSRLQDFVDETEKITQIDKGKLIVHLINMTDISEDEKQLEETKGQKYTTVKEFQQRKPG
jgi:hypothetical protein